MMQNEFLSDLFGSRLRAKLLGWLFTHTDERYFVRELTGLIKEDSTNISRELARLANAGILVSTTSGRQKYYQANIKSPIFNELHGLMLKTTGVADVLRSALKPAHKKIDAAFIFGSIATRTETRASDIDVMIIGDISFGDIVSLIIPAQEILGREINPVVYALQEFREKVMTDHHFVNSVLQGQKIFLIGDEDELNRISSRG
jgi:predicted nucleotidyltransferase